MVLVCLYFDTLNICLNLVEHIASHLVDAIGDVCHVHGNIQKHSVYDEAILKHFSNKVVMKVYDIIEVVRPLDFLNHLFKVLVQNLIREKIYDIVENLQKSVGEGFYFVKIFARFDLFFYSLNIFPTGM